MPGHPNQGWHIKVDVKTVSTDNDLNSLSLWSESFLTKHQIVCFQNTQLLIVNFIWHSVYKVFLQDIDQILGRAVACKFPL